MVRSPITDIDPLCRESLWIPQPIETSFSFMLHTCGARSEWRRNSYFTQLLL